jgi:hypothetical protein
MSISALKEAFIANQVTEEFVADSSAFQRGRLLVAMKELCPSGEWLNLLSDLKLTKQKASELMSWQKLFVEQQTSGTPDLGGQKLPPALKPELQTSGTPDLTVEIMEAAVPLRQEPSNHVPNPRLSSGIPLKLC